MAVCGGSGVLFAQLHFSVVDRGVVEQRLQSYKGDDSLREATLKRLFQASGCEGGELSEQPVEGSRQPNLICILHGDTDSRIVVGAHFDHVEKGDGVVDNWSGASLLPSLYEVLRAGPRRHTFVFIGFCAEEQGLVGSRFYVNSLRPDEVQKINAMVNLDTLALGPSEVWVSRSDRKLVAALNSVAHALKLPLTGVNVDAFGESDEEPFIKRHVPVIIVHSLTQQTTRVLHTRRDNYTAVHFDDYYNSYRLLSAYLVDLDEALPAQ
jgi:Zn-dependent M28 family amino/carboxypeptidase